MQNTENSNSSFLPDSGAAAIDLSACDREQIQFSGAIQPHGVLLALEEPELLISEASENTRELLKTHVVTMLGQPLSSALPVAVADWLLGRTQELPIGVAPVHLGTITVHGREFEVFAHRVEKQLVLELEQISAEPVRTSTLYAEVRACMAELKSTSQVEDLLAIAARYVRKLTGFDRVLGMARGTFWQRRGATI